jgi:predicted GH43/DUF377 family glycosyl hydrolase
MIGTEHDGELLADPGRVVARLFLPGEGVASSHSRAAEIVQRVLEIPSPDVEDLARDLLEVFSARVGDASALFASHTEAVSSRLHRETTVSAAQSVVLGASFTAEYAVEGAALCNPSAVQHPDQSGLKDGQLRVAVALRAIGEGHISSIGFAEAVIGPGERWEFVERVMPLTMPVIAEGTWDRTQFEQALEHDHYLNELTSAVLGRLPERFTPSDLEDALAALPDQLTRHRDSRVDRETLRRMAASAYVARFDEDSALSQRILLPVADEEDHGMEDARFARTTAADGSTEYRATYTAYDGRAIAPRLITSPDLATFSIHRLSGSAARNKGMALFPRLVGGEHLALSRTDGQNISLARSADGFDWSDAGMVHRSVEPWEMIQTGNCGSPIETEHGWLAIIHGVGPMRTYSIGALLLDLDDPRKVLARSATPFLVPTGERRNGYVPNVVYSCGGIVHENTLWVPFGVGDHRIRVFSVTVDELIESLSPC